MKSKQAKRILRERESLQSQLAEAEDLIQNAARALASAERHCDEAVAQRAMAQEGVEHARSALDMSLLVLAEAGNRLLDFAHLAAEAARTVERATGRRDKIQHALDRPRYREAQARLEKAREAQEIHARKVVKPEVVLTPEAVEGLKLLKSAFRMENVKGPSRVFVPAEGGRERDLDEEELRLPCDECGAEVGQPCDEARHAALEGGK